LEVMTSVAVLLGLLTVIVGGVVGRLWGRRR
jgi:hypothetical protein